MDLLNTEQQLQFKHLLKEQCRSILQERITTIENAMKEAQEAANSEEKSSAGDKYETGRAMNQLNKEMYAAQLEEALKEMVQLQAADVTHIKTTAMPGAVVVTNLNTLFIAAAMGALKTEKGNVMVLSPKAPLAVALHGKKAGDTITLNGKAISVTALF